MHTFTEAELLQYNGVDPSKPIYLALDGDVYDVSANPGMYGKVRPKAELGSSSLADLSTLIPRVALTTISLALMPRELS
jgi:predicted heme/steroid binding protein